MIPLLRVRAVTLQPSVHSEPYSLPMGAWEPDSRPVWKWVGLGAGVGAGRHMPVGLPAQREGARTNRVRSSDSSCPSWG